MKRLVLPVALLALGVSSFAVAQNISVPNLGSLSQSKEAPKEQKVVKVVTITGSQAIAEFYRNVNTIQSERNAMIELQSKVTAEKNSAKRKELQTQLDAAIKKLEDDNATMVKGYRFSLARQYVVDVDQISVYVIVSDTEAAQMERDAKEAAAKDQTKPKK